MKNEKCMNVIKNVPAVCSSVVNCRVMNALFPSLPLNIPTAIGTLPSSSDAVYDVCKNPITTSEGIYI